MAELEGPTNKAMLQSELMGALGPSFPWGQVMVGSTAFLEESGI